MLAIRPLWLLLTLLAVILSGSANADQATKLPPEEQAALNEVIESVRQNNSAFKAFHALNVLHIEPPDEPIVAPKSVDPGPDGGVLTFVAIPGQGATLRYDIWFDGLSERVEEKGIGSLVIWHDGVITNYWPPRKRAQIYPEEKKPVFSQHDPRQIGFIRNEGDLLNVLTGTSDNETYDDVEVKHDIQSVKQVDRDGRKLVVIEAKNPKHKVTTVLECDAAKNHLPTRIYYRRENGEIEALTDIEYTQVQNDPQPAWFPISAVQHFTGSLAITSPDSDNWGQTSTITIKDLEVNPEVPEDTFAIPEFPEGTRVSDSREKTET